VLALSVVWSTIPVEQARHHTPDLLSPSVRVFFQATRTPHRTFNNFAIGVYINNTVSPITLQGLLQDKGGVEPSSFRRRNCFCCHCC